MQQTDTQIDTSNLKHCLHREFKTPAKSTQTSISISNSYLTSAKRHTVESTINQVICHSGSVSIEAPLAEFEAFALWKLCSYDLLRQLEFALRWLWRGKRGGGTCSYTNEDSNTNHLFGQ